MRKKRWTATDVADRFEEAVYVLRRMDVGRTKPMGYFSTMPEVVRTTAEILQAEPDEFQLGSPTAEAISRMEETIEWIFWLDDEDERRVVWLRAANVPWEPICRRLGFGRTKGWQIWTYALIKIMTRLNTKQGAR